VHEHTHHPPAHQVEISRVSLGLLQLPFGSGGARLYHSRSVGERPGGLCFRRCGGGAAAAAAAAAAATATAAANEALA